MKILSERLTMTQITKKHWSLFHTLHTDPLVISLCFDEPSTFEIEDKFNSRLKPWSSDSDDWLCLVVIDNETNESVGITGFCIKNKTAEVGFMFLPQYHGKGYATESLTALLAYSKLNLNINNYNAIVTEGNIGSEKVLIKSGFTLKNITPEAYKIGDTLYADHIYHN